MLNTGLIGRRCRKMNAQPPAAQTTPDDYYFEVVAAWLNPSVNMSGLTVGHTLELAVIDVRNGETNVYTFFDLEFEPERP